MKNETPTPMDDGNSLVRLMGQILDESGDGAAYENENFVAWLEREIHGRIFVADGATSEMVARQVANRARARIRVAHASDALPLRPFRARNAEVVGNVKQITRIAAESCCAPWVESLAVAAGLGREIWDEPCEQWVELPKGSGPGAHVALTVSGDSMIPCLTDGDVILVNTRKPVTLGCIVVARRAENGYVVKHVTRCGKAILELSSFNSDYAPFTIERSPGAIVGVVTARLVREEQAS